MLSKLYEYVEDVKSGKAIVGIEIKQAVARFERDLLRDDIYFDEKKVEKAITFISHLRHFTSSHNNKQFILEPWQAFIIGNIFGWYKKSTNTRRFTDVYLELARKNGKSALSSAISLYCLTLEGEASAYVVFAANSREQAKYSYEILTGFASKLDPQQRNLKVFKNEVRFRNNILKVVASDTSKLDGSNPSCVLLDEFHEAKNTKLYSVLKSGQGMREQPLFIIITTAGFNKKLPCYRVRTTAKEVLEGLKEDDSSFIAIFSLDINDDWTNKKNWPKANPNLGVTVKESYIENEVNKAKNNVSLETEVKTKHLNLWCDTITTWIPDRYVLQASKNITFDDLTKKDEIYVGVDLSSTSDITAVSYMFIKNGKYNFKVDYYLPVDSLNSLSDKEYYKTQHKLNNLTFTSGNVIDYDYILNDILTVNKNHRIKVLAYDSWNAAQFAISAEEKGLELEPFSQTKANFNRPTKEFERLILQNNVILNNNEITRWMFSNVNLTFDSNGNAKPDKSQKDKKIDGIIAMLMSLGIYLNTPRNVVSIF